MPSFVKVLYVDANADYQEVRNTIDTIQAFGFDASGEKITSVADGTADTDAVNYGQLQAAINGFDWKQSVRLATLTNVNLAAPGATLDGLTMASGNRFLAVGQTAGAENGLYVWNGAASAATRSTDANTNIEVTSGLTVAVSEGTSADHIYQLMTADPIVLDTTSLSFQKIVINSIVGGAGITFAGEVVSVDTYTSGGLQEIGAGNAAQLAVKAADISGSGLIANVDTIHVDIDWATAVTDNKAWKASDLYSTSNGKGASTIGIEDVGGFTLTTNVEDALQELYNTGGAHRYTVGAGGVTKGDLVYISADDTVSKMPINAAHVCAGVALSTVAAAGLVAVKRFDTIVLGALAGATVDQKYFWNGSALTTTMPSASGSYVWQAGSAVNATDFLTEVEFVKRNA